LIKVLGGENPLPSCGFLDTLSYAASLNSVSKAWPDSCDCMEETLEEELKLRITKERLTLPTGYLRHVKECVMEIFPKGLRKKELEIHSRRVTPPFSATTENPRRKGGSYTSWHGRREDYLSSWEKPEVVHESEFMVAKAAGKPRPLVKNHSSYLLLRPLHTAIYDRISQQDWLLRGPPTKKRFLGAGFKPDCSESAYLSADYSSATDNLPIEVAETILDTLAITSSPVWAPILSEAKKSLRPTINFSNSQLTPQTGQMMGNLCSFPLLCLQNYAAATWVDKLIGKGKTPKLINGDDLVAQVSKEWLSAYKAFAPHVGLILNLKKTSYTRAFLTINSTYFSRNLKLIPFLRAKGLCTRDPRDVGTIMGDIIRPFQSVRSTRTPRLTRLLSQFFEKLVRSSYRTLYALGFRVKNMRGLNLKKSLMKREKERTGWGDMEEPIPRERHPMGLSLTLVTDPYGVHEDREVAESVVRAHWEGGEFTSPERLRLKEVRELLRSTRTTRCRGVGMKGTVARLIQSRPEPKVWIPEKLANCYDLSHDRSRLVEEDGQFIIEWDECPTCERVQEAISRKRKEKENLEKEESIVAEFDAIKREVNLNTLREAALLIVPRNSWVPPGNPAIPMML